MRRGLVDSGWAGSLFPEPIMPVASKGPEPWCRVTGYCSNVECGLYVHTKEAHRGDASSCGLKGDRVALHKQWDLEREQRRATSTVESPAPTLEERQVPIEQDKPYPVQLDGKWKEVSIIDNVVTVDGVICDDNFVPLTQPTPKLESPWTCDCRNCGEYEGGACPIYGCMCEPGCRKDPPCTIERCVGYWPATDQYDKMAEDRLIMYLQRVSTPTANEIAPLFPKELLAQAYNKGLIQGIENGSRYDLGESTEEFYWRTNNTPWTLAMIAKQNEGNGIGAYEPFAKWQLLMRNRQKAPPVSEMPFHVGDHVRLRSMAGCVRAITSRGFVEVFYDEFNFSGFGRPEEATLEPEAAAPKQSVAPAKKTLKAKKQPKLKSVAYNQNSLPGSNAESCSDCDCETCGLNQAHLNYTDKEWANCPPCGCDQCLGKDELQPVRLCGRKAALTAEVMGNTESCLPREQLHVDTVQRYVRPAECAEGSCTACQCQTCGYRNMNCALNGDEPVLICSTCWLDHPHHWKVYAAIVKTCPHWRDAATFPADILAPGMGPCPEIACELRYNGEGGPCLCQSCKYGPGSCDTSCNVPGYPMETGQYACGWYAQKVVTVEAVIPPAAELDVLDLVKVGDLVTRLHTRGYVYNIRKVTRVEKTDAGWQICGDRWDDFRHPRRKNVSKNEPIIQWDVTGWKVQEGNIVPLNAKAVDACYESMYKETYEDERLIILTLEQVEQLVAVEEAENINEPTWYTHVWLKPVNAKGHKNEQGYLEDPRKQWPCLGHARFVDTSAAAVAKIPSGRRSEVCQDEPECEHCLCKACEHQKDCRLDNTLNPCSPCKTSGGAHHHKAVDCEAVKGEA